MTTRLLKTDKLPYALYRAEQVRSLDRIAIEHYGIPGISLMERAGEAAFQLLRVRWPQARRICILCGLGNNAGDGYVVGRLALQAGFQVQVFQLGDPKRFRGDALISREGYLQAGGEIMPPTLLPKSCDLIVDAVFGTGLEREVTGEWQKLIDMANAHSAPVLALDIPSGIHSDTGAVLGVAVQANVTITFIGLKQGLFTGEAPAYTGEIRFNALDVPAAVYSAELISARRIDWLRMKQNLIPRSRIAHKGDFGHLLIIGGDQGYGGAARIAGEAALRCGAGLVSIASRYAQGIPNSERPELMVHQVDEMRRLKTLLQRATQVLIGPGLGQSRWAWAMLQGAISSRLPLVVDADALNLLAADPLQSDHWILTPHPGEAARLMNGTTLEVNADRFNSTTELQRQYGGTIILKGAGTLIQSGNQRPPALCSQGNPGMASGGTGDALSGIVGAFLAQGFDAPMAAEMGVALHAAAADAAALVGERGMLVSDLIEQIRPLVNPELCG